MRESLAPGGRVALVEYRKEDGTADHIKPEHTMSVREVLAEVRREKRKTAPGPSDRLEIRRP